MKIVGVFAVGKAVVVTLRAAMVTAAHPGVLQTISTAIAPIQQFNF